MRLLAIAFIAVLFSACEKEQPSPARITFGCICGSCEVTWGVEGGYSATDSIPKSAQPYVRELVVDVGDEVYITSTPAVYTDTATMVYLKVNDFQQDVRYAEYDTTVTLRLTVPELDRYGVKQ